LPNKSKVLDTTKTKKLGTGDRKQGVCVLARMDGGGLTVNLRKKKRGEKTEKKKGWSDAVTLGKQRGSVNSKENTAPFSNQVIDKYTKLGKG